MSGAVKPLRWPWLWLGLWWLAVLAVVVLIILFPPIVMFLPDMMMGG